MNLEDLKAPFPASDIEWRIGRAGKKNGEIWAMALAYVTNRAIQDRLDDVCGPENWKNEFWKGPDGGVVCEIAIRVREPDDWVSKQDGADNTEIEPVKGGLSGSMKRAAVQWGIGRYLYNLDEGWADVHSGGEFFGRLPKKKGGDTFRWDPPALPSWALPDGEEPKKKKGHAVPPKQKAKTSRQQKKNDEGDPELLRMGEELDEMEELGSAVEEMHLAIDQFLEGQREWTDGKKEAARKWLLTKVTRIDSARHRREAQPGGRVHGA